MKVVLKYPPLPTTSKRAATAAAASVVEPAPPATKRQRRTKNKQESQPTEEIQAVGEEQVDQKQTNSDEGEPTAGTLFC